MNLTRKKFFHVIMKCNFWDVKVKEYSTTLNTPRIIKNQFDEPNEQSLAWPEKKKIIDSVLSSDISPYINKSTISLLESCITYKRNFQTHYSFVVDSEVAKDIVDRILPELKEEKSFVVEANPGLALITLNLVKSQVPKIHIYDNSKLKNISLQQLLNKYPDQLHLEKVNILASKNNHLMTVLDDALKQNVNTKVIGVVQQLNFFSSFVQEYLRCCLWDWFEVTDFFLIITSKIWENVVQETESRSKYLTYCMFNLAFETQLLAEYPRSAFLPFSLNSKEDKMFFIKISKKSNFPGKLREEMKLFLSFSKILGRSKFNFIIPTLEQWIPECGPYLISKGISVTNQVNDLTYSEFKKLYLLLKKFKGFKNFQVMN